MNNATFSEKESFVTKNLVYLLKAIDATIINAKYVITNGEEFVIVTFSNDYRKTICVSCDSLSAMTKDVLNVLF